MKKFVKILNEKINGRAGFKARIDFTTDNIIVDDGIIGFVISKVCQLDWPQEYILEQIEKTLSAIEIGEEPNVKLWSVEELKKQAVGP